jgi:outer membrane protein TolC
MSSRFEPDAKFVDHLEWQLASEFRRREHLKPAPGRIAVPRSVAMISLAAGVLLLGVAATKAADLIKDSWRKKIEVARLETEVKIKTAFLGLKKDRSAQAENRFSLGLISEDEALVAKLGAERAAADLEKSALDLEEVKASGQAPRDELYAPLVRGRDFVGERLGIEKKVLQADLDLRRARTEPALRHRVELGLVPKSALSEFEAALAGQEAAIGDIENRLALRRRFLAGEISAGELEIQTRVSAAEKNLREAQSSIEAVRPRLEDLRAKAAVGLVTPDEVKGMELGLSAAQAKADLALQQIEILKQIK